MLVSVWSRSFIIQLHPSIISVSENIRHSYLLSPPNWAEQQHRDFSFNSSKWNLQSSVCNLLFQASTCKHTCCHVTVEGRRSDEDEELLTLKHLDGKNIWNIRNTSVLNSGTNRFRLKCFCLLTVIKRFFSDSVVSINVVTTRLHLKTCCFLSCIYSLKILTNCREKLLRRASLSLLFDHTNYLLTLLKGQIEARRFHREDESLPAARTFVVAETNQLVLSWSETLNARLVPELHTSSPPDSYMLYMLTAWRWCILCNYYYDYYYYLERLLVF